MLKNNKIKITQERMIRLKEVCKIIKECRLEMNICLGINIVLLILIIIYLFLYVF